MTLFSRTGLACAVGSLFALTGCAPPHRHVTTVYTLPACPGVEQALARVLTAREATPAGAECVNTRLQQLSQHLLAADAKIDLARAQAQVDALLARPELGAAQQAWGRLLLQQIVERRRMNDALEKQQAQTREQQKRADDLAAKLSALRDVDNALLLKSGKSRKVQP